jgi:hypothetical protein
MSDGLPVNQPSGPLSDYEVGVRAAKAINEKWVGDKLCPICRVSQWSSATTMQAYTYAQGQISGGGNHYAWVVSSCLNCGYVLIFNAIHLGFTSIELNRIGAPPNPPNPPESAG